MRANRVLVLAGGGTDHVSGGVGTMMLALQQEWRRCGEDPGLHIIDTRGAGGVASATFCFVRACILLLSAKITGNAGLVHAHMTTRGSVVRKALLCSLASWIGVPVILHMHGADFAEFFEALPAFAKRLVAWSLHQARQIVVLGDTWRTFLVEQAGVDPERIAIVLNGVAGPVPRRRAVLPGAPLRIVFLGRLGDRKGVPELLHALALPRMQRLAWVATVAGDGEVPRFVEMAAGLDLSGRVALPGWVGRAATLSLLQEADLLVLPSHHEALPMAVIEALAHHVAVIATPVGALPELLVDGENALLVPPGDIPALARAMARLIEEPETRARLAEAGHVLFASRLNIRAIAPRMLQLYRHAERPVHVTEEGVATYDHG